MSKSFYVVQSNPVPGREQEYNDWYTETHLPDLLRLSGVTAAQRFRMAPRQRPTAKPYSYQYGAIYELDGEPDQVFADLSQALKDGMYVSDAMSADRLAHLWLPHTDRLTAD